MKKQLRSSIFCICVLAFTPVAKAKIKLPDFFSDNMILQQKMNDAIWGWSNPNAKVNIMASWNARTFSVMADPEGKWKIFIPSPVAGGPYTMDIKDPDSHIQLKNILCGEVWFCSGQSNMEMPLKGYPGQPVSGSQDAIAQATNPMIHLLHVEKAMSVVPLDNVRGSWTECNAETAAEITAVGYFFGKYLQDILHIPVGIIHSNWGGTRIECWMSGDTLSTFPFVNLSRVGLDNDPSLTPTLLYNAMVAPFAGYGMRGCIWYQGESNRFEPKQYLQLMPALIDSWRSKWGIGDFSFYFCQIAPFFYWNESNNASFIREAQLQASLKTKNTGLAVTIDIGGEKDVHPKEKSIVGKRLAYWALAKDYGMKTLSCSGPVYKEMKINSDTVKLYFDYANNGLISADTLLPNFEIAAADHIFYPANAKINAENEMFVWSKKVANPVSVRYAWRNFVVGTLYNTEGLPASPFRTDDWDQ
jgi:sialate O-acetylesterase